MNKNKFLHLLDTYGIWLVYAIFIFLCGYVCFARLDVGLLQHWDEARHGVNAYEMMKNKNYIVNTYNYTNDYFNLKPPLSYWGILLGFRLFGVNIFGMRFYSALSMFLTFLVIAFYLHKKYGKTAAVTSMMLFLTFYDMFYWHAARHADADALYILLFTVGCICLMESIAHPWLISVCGLMFSLGFLAKSWHACVLLPIGGLFYIFSGLRKKMKLKDYLIFLLCTFGPILLWAVIRYQYDGMAFLGQMFGVDVTQRISWSESSNPNYFFFLDYLLRERSIQLMLGTNVLCTGFLAIRNLLFKRRPQDEANPNACSVFRLRGLLTWLSSPTVLTLLLWILVPLLVFSLSHTYYYWYVYPIFPALCISSAILVDLCRKNCKTRQSKLMLAAVLLLPALAVLHYDKVTIRQIDNLEISGFQQDIQAAMALNPELHGSDIYVEKNDNEYKDSFYWEQAGLLMAELSGDLKCEEGGVEAFLKADAGALLIVDPYFYQVYKDRLAGMEVVYEREYLVLQK